MSEISRRQLITANIGGKRTVLRPPWALGGGMFENRCDGCGECISGCPENILFLTPAKKAAARFDGGECTFCGECADRCRIGALSRDTVKTSREPPWPYRAQIDTRCLARNGVACLTCVEVCDFGAISLVYRIGAIAAPEINSSKCSGCGACFAPCPVSAIVISSNNILINKSAAHSAEFI